MSRIPGCATARWSKTNLQRSGLTTCSIRISPRVSHQARETRSNLVISRASTFKLGCMLFACQVVEGAQRTIDFLPGDVVEKDAVAERGRHRHPLIAVTVLNAFQERLPEEFRVERARFGHHAE